MSDSNNTTNLLIRILIGVIVGVFLLACAAPVIGISGLTCLGNSLDAKFAEEAARD